MLSAPVSFNRLGRKLMSFGVGLLTRSRPKLPAPSLAEAAELQKHHDDDPDGSKFNSLPPLDASDLHFFGEITQGMAFIDFTMRRAIAVADPAAKEPSDSDVAAALTNLLGLVARDQTHEAELVSLVDQMENLREFRNYVAHWMARSSPCGKFYLFHTTNRKAGERKSGGQINTPVPAGKAVFAVVAQRDMRRRFETAMHAHDAFSLSLF